MEELELIYSGKGVSLRGTRGNTNLQKIKPGAYTI